MKVSREFLQKVVRQEYRKLLSENIDDMQDMDTDMNMFGSGYEASETDDEHIHDIADESKMLELIGRLRATAPNPAAGD